MSLGYFTTATTGDFTSFSLTSGSPHDARIVMSETARNDVRVRVVLQSRHFISLLYKLERGVGQSGGLYFCILYRCIHHISLRANRDPIQSRGYFLIVSLKSTLCPSISISCGRLSTVISLRFSIVLCEMDSFILDAVASVLT